MAMPRPPSLSWTCARRAPPRATVAHDGCRGCFMMVHDKGALNSQLLLADAASAVAATLAALRDATRPGDVLVVTLCILSRAELMRTVVEKEEGEEGEEEGDGEGEGERDGYGAGGLGGGAPRVFKLKSSEKSIGPMKELPT